MPFLILQLAVLIALAFFVGCVAGRLIRGRKATAPEREQVIVAAALAEPPAAPAPEKPVQPQASPAPEVAAEEAEPKPVPAAEVVGPAPEPAPPAPEDPDRPAWRDAPRRGKADDLTAIAGIGKAVESMLHEIGIFHHDQIAGWTREEARWVERRIGFPGRVEREGWIAQATSLTEAAAKPAAKRAPRARKSPARTKTKAS